MGPAGVSGRELSDEEGGSPIEEVLCTGADAGMRLDVLLACRLGLTRNYQDRDRKSTRLNSSHW